MAKNPKKRIRRRGLRFGTGFVEGKPPFSHPKMVELTDHCYDLIDRAPRTFPLQNGVAVGRYAFMLHGYGFSLEYDHEDGYWVLHIVMHPEPKKGGKSGKGPESRDLGNKRVSARAAQMRRSKRATLKRTVHYLYLKSARTLFRHELVRHVQSMIGARPIILSDLRLPALTWPRLSALTSPIISLFRDIETARLHLVAYEARLEPIELNSVIRLPFYTMRSLQIEPAFEPLWPISLFGERLEGDFT